MVLFQFAATKFFRLVFVEDSGGEESVNGPVFRGIVLPVEDDGFGGLPRTDVRMLPETVRGKRPKRIWGYRRTANHVLNTVISLPVEMPDFHQLLGAGIAVKLRTVLHHLGSRPAAYSGKGVKSGGIRFVDVRFGDIDEWFQPLIHRVRHHERFGKV